MKDTTTKNLPSTSFRN